MRFQESKITTEDIKKASDVLKKILKEDREKKIKKEMKWIPTSERLPKKEGKYLTCNQNGKMLILEYVPDHDYSFPIEKDETEMFENGYVKAWMPLPEPYRGEQNDE